jgi:hypothetical protein
MGALGGNVSVRRFRAAEDGSGLAVDRAVRDITMHTFQPIDPRGEEERSIGWVVAGDPFDVEIDRTKLFFDEWLVVGMRVDTLRVRKVNMAPMLRERIEAYTHEHGGLPDRRARKRLEAEVKRTLRHRILPTTHVYDVAWHVGTGLVLFWSTSEQLGGAFIEIFERTFDLRLDQVGPAAVAAGGVKTKAHRAALEVLRPTRQFVEGFFR